MNRRSPARRLRRIERGRIGWRFHVEQYTDEHGEKWERHVATNPRGAVAYFEAPPPCETEQEWLGFVERMQVRRGVEMPKAPTPITTTAAGDGSGGVLSIPETNSSGGGTSLH